MKSKRNSLIVALAGILAVGTTLVYAHNQGMKDTPTTQEVSETSYNVNNYYNPDDKLKLFTTFRGTVAEISESYTNKEGETLYTLVLGHEEEAFAHVHIKEDDVFILGTSLVEDSHLVSIKDISVGDEIIVYCEVLPPAPTVLPTIIGNDNVSTIFIVNNEHPVNVHVDIYTTFISENKIVSLDTKYRLPRTTKDITTEQNILVLDRNNQIYEGSLENKVLAVIFGVTTRERTPMLQNSKVIVLGDAEDVKNFQMAMKKGAICK